MLSQRSSLYSACFLWTRGTSLVGVCKVRPVFTELCSQACSIWAPRSQTGYVVIQKTQPFLSPGHTCLTWPLTVATDVRDLDEKSGVKKYMVYYTTVLKVTWDETPIFWSPDVKNWLIGKDPDAGKDWRREEKGTTEDESWWWTGRPCVLQPMGWQRVGHDWATELNWNDKWRKHGNFSKKDFF